MDPELDIEANTEVGTGLGAALVNSLDCEVDTALETGLVSPLNTEASIGMDTSGDTSMDTLLNTKLGIKLDSKAAVSDVDMVGREPVGSRKETSLDPFLSLENTPGARDPCPRRALGSAWTWTGLEPEPDTEVPKDGEKDP